MFVDLFLGCRDIKQSSWLIRVYALYIPNLSTLLSLKILAKLPGGWQEVGGGCSLNPILVFMFSLSLSQACVLDTG